MAKDLFHDIVRNALIKDGWTITHDPFVLSFFKPKQKIDLGAQKEVLAAEKNHLKIAVEIKSFLGESFIYDFYEALGQFFSYRIGLKKQEPERQLFLAVNEETYKEYFGISATEAAVSEMNMKIVVFDPEQEIIVEWIS